MKKEIYFLSGLMFLFLTMQSQVVVTDDETYLTGESSSVMDIKSESKGILLPRMNGHNIANPVNGLLVFDTVTDSYWHYKNNEWTELLSGGSANNRMIISDSGYVRFLGEATAWEDLTVAVSSTKTGGSNPPQFGLFKNDGGSLAGSAGGLQFNGASQARIEDVGLYALNTDHTIEFWLKPSIYTLKNKQILRKNNLFYIQYRKDNKLAVKYHGLGYQQGDIELNVGNWNYIVLTMHQDAGITEIKLYINSQEACVISSSASINNNNNRLEFNINSTSFEIDNMAVWGKAFTEDDVATGYNDGDGLVLTGSETDLNGYWKLDETSGASFADQTSTGNTGTVTGTENSDYTWVDGHVGAASASSLGIFTYWFDPNVEQELFFTVQMFHAWKEGSALYPHIHWIGKENGTAGADVSWGLEYSFANVGESFSNTTIIYGDENIFNENIVADKHYITKFPTIEATGKTLSSMILCRLFRDAKSVGGTDDYHSEAGILEIDFHYQVDALGSDLEYIKYGGGGKK